MSRRILLVALIASFAAPAHAAPRTATPPSSITVPAGFEVELIRSAQESESSWISMAFDAQGRIVVGLDDVGVARLAPPATAGGEWSFTRLDDTLRHCRGVLVHDGSLYVNACDSKELWRFRDTDGDGTYRDRTNLKSFDYRSRYGHGQNQLTVGPDGAIWSIVGNDVTFPEGTSPESPYRDPGTDRLLPDPADADQDDRVGYLLRFDPEGSAWTVFAGGFRNQVDADWNADGEWFTWDSDMEWDVGQPWYRPTRVNHVVSGAEYGWRWSTLNWPPSYPDSLPATLETGLGSPTGVVFGRRGTFPGKWRDALYMADWQHGRILAAWFTPDGASYAATDELFAEGSPMNVCDMAFGPDGALWFITGGRGSQSGLYRVSFTGDQAAVAPSPVVDSDVAAAAKAARARRRELEAFHGGRLATADLATIENLWPDLGSSDRWLRTAARIALERQPRSAWREKVRGERHPLARGEGLLAWVRMAPAEERSEVVRATLAGPVGADEPEVLLALRVLSIALARGVELPEADRKGIHDLLATLDGHPSALVQRELLELLVATESPGSIQKGIERLDRAASQEDQIHCVHTLVRSKGPWTLAHHRRLLDWFADARSFRGGHLIGKIIARMQGDLVATIPESEKPALAEALALLDKPMADGEAIAAAPLRPFVRHWTQADLAPHLDKALAPRDADAGRRALAAAQCLKCHRLGSSGAAIGPDLSAIGKRFDARGIVESILEPSKVVDPKYHATTWVLGDGRVVTGRANMVNDREIGVETSALTGESLKLLRSEIESSHPATVSPMPEGLLDTLSLDEILDLVALLRGGPAGQ
jgi:putative heme-binding domain-containing protein